MRVSLKFAVLITPVSALMDNSGKLYDICPLICKNWCVNPDPIEAAELVPATMVSVISVISSPSIVLNV